MSDPGDKGDSRVTGEVHLRKWRPNNEEGEPGVGSQVMRECCSPGVRTRSQAESTACFRRPKGSLDLARKEAEQEYESEEGWKGRQRTLGNN